MKKIGTHFLFIFSLLILYNNNVIAQEKQIQLSGNVTDKQTSETLIGVNVFIKGTVKGTVTDVDGNFTLSTKVSLPVILVISHVGYEPQTLEFNASASGIKIALATQDVLGQDVVVTASRVEEKIARSPVAIEKLDARALKETAAASFFDAMENVKGVQMTTLSLGFKVPNTRGFANTTNARFLEMVDGADTQAPGLGVSIANTVGPTELDVQSIEITPGASSALYGMNALNGISNIITKNPFFSEGLSVYQKTGVNHVDGVDYSPKVFTESAIRYAKAFKEKFAFKVNFGYLKGTDWVASSSYELNPDANASVNLKGDDNPAKDPINSYGNESGNRKTLTLADGKLYEVRRTGYYEKDLVNDNYNVSNLKGDVGLYYRLTDKIETSYSYRIGISDAIYQRGNRIRLDDYQIQQHKFDLKGNNFFVRAYYTIEHTDKSYNIRPMGENLDRNFKSDTDWFNLYKSKFNENYNNGVSVVEAHRLARVAADQGRYEPGTEIFDQKLHELTYINNWDLGAQLKMDHKFYHTEAQYDFRDLVKVVDILAGVDYRDFLITPEGNSFKNPDPENPLGTLHYNKVGGFLQLTKRLFHDNLKLIASARVDKNQYFDAKINPRVAAVYTLADKHNFRASYQNGFRFPTLFEGFSTVNNGGVIRYGGLEVISKDLQLFENSYIRSSVDKFQKKVVADVNGGKTQAQAIIDNQGLLVRNTYTYLKPEDISSIDFGYKGAYLNDKVLLDVDFYYNVYNNFIDQIEIAVPKNGKIGDLVNGVDSTIFQVYDNSKQTRYRMWTNAKSTYYNYGASLGLTWNFYHKFLLSTNVSYAKLDKVDAKDSGLETPFNTPEWIANVTLGNREIVKNLGFNVTWRWQDAFAWKAPLGNGTVPAYHTVDAQVTLRLPKWFTTLKLGGSNILNKRYYQYQGGPTIGGLYYLAITFDGLK